MKKEVYINATRELQTQKQSIKEKIRTLEKDITKLDQSQSLIDTEFGNSRAKYRVGVIILLKEKRQLVNREVKIASIHVAQISPLEFRYRCFKIKNDGAASGIIHRGAALHEDDILGPKPTK